MKRQRCWCAGCKRAQPQHREGVAAKRVAASATQTRVRVTARGGARRERTFAPLASAIPQAAPPAAAAAHTPSARWQQAIARKQARFAGQAQRPPTPALRAEQCCTPHSRRRCALRSATPDSASGQASSTWSRTGLAAVCAHVRRRARVGAQLQLVEAPVSACRELLSSAGDRLHACVTHQGAQRVAACVLRSSPHARARPAQ